MKLAYFYGEGRGGTSIDYIQAYKWYDIAAALVGAKIDELPVAASHKGEKDNSHELRYRDQVAKHTDRPPRLMMPQPCHIMA